MTTLIRQIALISILGTSIFVFDSCSPCFNNEEEKTFKLTDQLLELIPYTDQQVIKFKNHQSNEEFSVTVRRSPFLQKFDFSACAGECCDVFYNIELESTAFDYTNDSSLFPKLLLSSYAETTPNEGNKGSLLFDSKIEYDYRLSTLALGRVFSRFGEIDVHIDNNFQLECGSCTTMESFQIVSGDSLHIGKVYDKVLKVEIKEETESTTEYTTYIYYFVPEIGIIKIERRIYTSYDRKILKSVEEYFAVL